MNYVIIGNSAAAVGCIEAIRQIDQNSPITVVTDEAHHTYSRPLISYLLSGKTTEKKMMYRPDDFYEKMNCRVLFSTTCTKINPADKNIVVDSGEIICYNKLLIATGSSPFIPPMEGLDTVSNKHTFMSLDDAKKLDASMEKDARVLIVGGGLIGLKCAEGIYKKTPNITVVDLSDRILPSILDDAGSKLVQKHIEKHKITFHLCDSVKCFSKNSAVLNSGAEIGFDSLVIAVGVRPNVALAKEAGLAVSNGILTDEFCKTSDPDIYSAGDCCESFDITISKSRVLALLPNAYMQGECAGLAMAGSKKPYDKAIPMNAIGFFGMHIITAGSYDGKEILVKSHKGYKKLVVKDDLLKGFILVENIERAGIYTSLIREQVPLSTIDFELIKEKPQLMAFSKIERGKKLGGVKV